MSEAPGDLGSELLPMEVGVFERFRIYSYQRQWIGLHNFPAATSASTTTAAGPAVTAESILEGVRKAVELLEQKCPVAEFMRSKGCDPDDGWILFMPESERTKQMGILPSYIRFHPFAKEPLMLNPTAAGVAFPAKNAGW